MGGGLRVQVRSSLQLLDGLHLAVDGRRLAADVVIVNVPLCGCPPAYRRLSPSGHLHLPHQPTLLIPT